MKTLRLLLACALTGATALIPARLAASVTWKQLTFGGFLSQGYLYSNHNNFPTDNQDGTWDFREMALNVSAPIGAHARIGAQAFAQRFGQIGGDKVILDWAVADYNFNSAFGVRVGRIKYPKGLYGEALDLDVVRPFVFLPNAVYSPVLRDFSASFDGGMIYGSLAVGQGSLDYKLFYGDIPITPQKGVAEFYNNSGLFAKTPGVRDLSIDSVMGGQLVWNPPVSGLKLAYSYSEYSNLYSAGPFAAYPLIDIVGNFQKFSWHTVSAEYAYKDWVFAGEWQRCGGGLDYSAAPLLPLVQDHSGWDGWYLSASRRLNSRFEVGAYYGQLTQRYEGDTGDPRRHQYDAAVSVRFDYSEHVLFKLELHSIDGRYQTFDTVRIPNPAPADSNVVIAVKTTLSF